MRPDEIPFVLDYLTTSFDRKPFDPTDNYDAAAMLIWTEDLAGHDQAVCIEAIRSLRRAGTERWFPTHAAVEQAIQAVLRRKQLERPALVEDTGPPVSRETALAHIAALKQRHPKGSDPKPIKASMPRINASAHDLGDHQFCGDECQTEAIPETVDRLHSTLRERSGPVDAHSMGDHQFCGGECDEDRQSVSVGDAE